MIRGQRKTKQIDAKICGQLLNAPPNLLYKVIENDCTTMQGHVVYFFVVPHWAVSARNVNAERILAVT